jgi:hypothetical protein
MRSQLRDQPKPHRASDMRRQNPFLSTPLTLIFTKLQSKMDDFHHTMMMMTMINETALQVAYIVITE